MNNSEVKNVIKLASTIDVLGKEFNLALLDNIEVMKAKMIVVDGLIKPTDAYKEIEKQKNKLFNSYADTDEKGDVITKPDGKGNFTSTITDKAKLAKYNKDIEKLREDNKKVIDKHEAKIEEYLEALDDEYKATFIKIDRNKLPSDLKTKHIFLLSFMINKVIKKPVKKT